MWATTHSSIARFAKVREGSGVSNARHATASVRWSGYAEQVDLRGYERVECPVCEGAREWHDRPCPACGGEGELDQRQVDQMDMRDYQMIECPAAVGTTITEHLWGPVA